MDQAIAWNLDAHIMGKVFDLLTPHHSYIIRRLRILDAEL